jgi:hypothetical protein
MADFITYLEGRVQETKRTLQSVTERIQKANVERETLIADLEGYERTLSAEKRIRGVEAEPLQSEAIHSSNGSRAGLPEVNKADFARQFIRDHPGGVLPRDIMRGFQEKGIPIGKPYIYALVQRLQKQGQIRQRRDRWYPVEPGRTDEDSNDGGVPLQ